MMCDPKVRAQVREHWATIRSGYPRMYADAVNAVLRDVPPEVTVTIHTCRGNFKSTWMASGGYDPVAETVFTRPERGRVTSSSTTRSAPAASSRCGSCRRARRSCSGWSARKVAELEKKDDLKRRIDAAARYVPLENLCLSPQCGFSSTHHGNTITVDDQKRKLALALEVARDVWGAI